MLSGDVLELLAILTSSLAFCFLAIGLTYRYIRLKKQGEGEARK